MKNALELSNITIIETEREIQKLKKIKKEKINTLNDLELAYENIRKFISDNGYSYDVNSVLKLYRINFIENQSYVPFSLKTIHENCKRELELLYENGYKGEV